MSSELDKLFLPDTIETFTIEALGRHALYVEGTSGKFGDLVSWKTLNRLMAYGGLSHPRFRLTNGGREIPEADYWRRSRNGYSQLRVAEVNALLRGGSLLEIEAIEQLHEPISEFCATLEDVLSVPVQVDLYARLCGGGPRPGLQWNDHETLLFQVDGRNRWTLFQPTAYYPVATQEVPAPDGEPRWQGILHAGDLLYIPRGWWYCDEFLDAPSLYLAVIFKNPRGLDMVWRLFERLVEKETIRVDIPRFEAPERQSAFLTDLQREVCELAAQPGLLLGLLSDLGQIAEPRVEFNLPWSVASQSSPPSEDCLVVPLIRFPRAETSRYRRGFDGKVDILHDGRRLSADPEITGLLDRLCSVPFPKVRELLNECGNYMPRERILVHLSELIASGLISVRDAVI